MVQSMNNGDLPRMVKRKFALGRSLDLRRSIFSSNPKTYNNVSLPIQKISGCPEAPLAKYPLSKKRNMKFLETKRRYVPSTGVL